ncbi:TPA: polymorphic toxin-type HINT domain-containing protein, partial [Neisseria meningitidis]
VSDGIGNSQTLVSNKIHPFYSQGKWIQADRLKKGDTLLSKSGAKQTVQNITLKQQPLKAYNLTVADWHTYFVKGSQAETEGVWVHNSCPPKRAPEYHAGTVSESNFLNAAEKWLGENYKSYPNGRYVSQDGMRQVRYGYHETNSSTHHGHFESYDKPNGRVIKNSAVTIIRD